MASLNTLRTKGGWFLTGVILIALLAFILSDLTSCQGNQNPVVGKINGVKVKYNDYMREVQNQDALIKMAGGQDDGDQASDNAWGELIMQHSYLPGLELLGLGNSEQEQIDMSSGVYISPVIMNSFRNPQTGVFDPEFMRAYVHEAGQNPAMRAQWAHIQKQMNDERRMSKFIALAANGMMVNDLEVQAGLDADNNAYDARVIFKPYSSIADSTVTVSDAEIRDYYKGHQTKFQREASRGIEYVSFDIVPSAEDMEAGSKRADELAAEFAAAENPATFVTLNSPDDRTPPVFVRESAVETSIAAALLDNPGAFYGPVLNGETFTMARLAETRMIPDSVTFSIIAVSPFDNNLADSLLGVANSRNFADLARAHSQDTNTADMGGEIGTVDPLLFSQNYPKMTDALISAREGQIVKVEEASAIFLLNVTHKAAPVSKVKIATVKYTVRPSSTTKMNVMTQAREFYEKAKGSYDDYQKAVTEMALPKRTATIGITDRNVNGVENSRTLVRWAFDSKVGAVKEPEEFNNSYVLVPVLRDVVEKGVAPVGDVSSEIRALLRQRKKADMLAQQMTGTSLDAVAQAQSLEVHDVEGLKFSAFVIPGLGFEPRLVGAICGAEQTGTLSAPVSGSQGVYLFEVTGIEKTEEISEVDERLRLESIGQYLINQLILISLNEGSNIEDNRVRL